MTKNEFDNLDKETKNIVLEEMLELYGLVEYYPNTYENLKIFTEWHSYLAKNGQELKNFLNGIYPMKVMSEGSNIEILELVKESYFCLNFVYGWNKFLKIKQKDIIDAYF